MASFERLLKLCLQSKCGEYLVKSADEKVSYEANEKTWLKAGNCLVVRVRERACVNPHEGGVLEYTDGHASCS